MNFIAILIIALFTSESNIPAFATNFPEAIYVGVENPISINLNQCEKDDLQIKISHGNVYKRQDSLYIVSVSQQVVEEVKIKLYYKKLIIESKTLPLKPVPAALVAFNISTPNNFISVNQLSQIKSLGFNYESGYPENLKGTIYIANVQINSARGQIVGLINNGAITPNILNEIYTLKKGDHIIISNVQSLNKSRNNVQNVGGSFIFTIVE
jgi:hypothetical protein